MKMKVKKYNSMLASGCVSVSTYACNDFLDKYPDSRMDLKNPTEVSQLFGECLSTSAPSLPH